MARYRDDSRERVRDAIDFVELVGARTELRQAGPRRMVGLCPFHEERTPSFGIDPVEKLYHCFGCQAGGDVFTFVMETEGLDFARAIESLAERAGIELEREAEDPREAEQRQQRERLLALLERTAAFYGRLLWESAEAAPARAYLAGRGLEEGALREFRVGWSPAAWDRVLTGSRRAGYTEAELLASGLAQRRRDGPGAYDRFRGRIMFPLADERGRVLGFGARAVAPGDEPKYLNTSDGRLFHKGRIVYGADLARAAAAKAGRVVLVEGYTDVIALRQAGIPETVCSMGTALTDQQVDALKRLAPRVLLCLDPDAAGQEAVAKGTSAIRAFNATRDGDRLDVRVVRLPPGRDPADLVREEGAAAVRSRLDGSVPVARFEVDRALQTSDLESAEGRDRALAVIAPVIARLGPTVLRDDLVRLTADRLQMSESLAREALGGRASPGRGRSGGGSWSRGSAVSGTSGRGLTDRGPSRKNVAEGGQSRQDFADRGLSRRDLAEGTQSRQDFIDRGPSRRVFAEGGSSGSGISRGGAATAHGRTGAAGAAPSGRMITSVDLREDTERAFLARCLAVKEAGRAQLESMDIDATFGNDLTRRAAHYLVEHLEHPGQSLPSGADALARLVAELVIRAGDLAADPAALALERLALDKLRLDRLITAARGAGEPVTALALERQQIQDAIRHRLV
jgi:DNA primase